MHRRNIGGAPELSCCSVHFGGIFRTIRRPAHSIILRESPFHTLRHPVWVDTPHASSPCANHHSARLAILCNSLPHALRHFARLSIPRGSASRALQNVARFDISRVPSCRVHWRGWGFGAAVFHAFRHAARTDAPQASPSLIFRHPVSSSILRTPMSCTLRSFMHLGTPHASTFCIP